MNNKSPRRSSLGLAVLALLSEEPMHPYRMQFLIKERGIDEVINVRQRTSLYQTVERLMIGGLIRVREMSRDGRLPERTVYEITDAGRDLSRMWLRDMLAVPDREFPEFPAAIAFLALLKPEDALEQMERRVTALTAEIARMDAQMLAAAAVPRLFLLEGEYQRAAAAMEMKWVCDLISDMHAGRITWSDEWLKQVATQFNQPTPDS